MFSKMMAGLRTEAEKVSASNAMMLEESYQKALLRDDRGMNKTQATGLGLGMSGGLGIMGLAMANQAAALGGVSALASASTALAGLGTVAVGAAILPVASVIAIGVGVAGVAALGIGSLMKLAQRDANSIGREIRDNRDFGHESASVSDWLKGAKNLVVNSLRDQFMGKTIETRSNDSLVQSAEKSMGRDAVLDYEIANAVDDDLGKADIVEKLGAEIWDKYGVVVTDEEIKKSLGGERDNSNQTGKILKVDLEKGIIVQSLGQGRATIHPLKDFQRPPIEGQVATVAYKGGKMQEGREQGQEREGGRVLGGR